MLRFLGRKCFALMDQVRRCETLGTARGRHVVSVMPSNLLEHLPSVAVVNGAFFNIVVGRVFEARIRRSFALAILRSAPSYGIAPICRANSQISNDNAFCRRTRRCVY